MENQKLLDPRRRVRFGILFVVLLCVPFSGCRWGDGPPITTQKGKVPEPIIRVKLMGPAPFVPVAIDGPYTAYSFNGKAILQGPSLPYAEVKLEGDVLSLGTQRVRIGDYCDLVPNRKGSLALDRQYYRGSLRLCRTADGQLLAVNHIPIEDYLKGVLRGELPNTFGLESYKALAVAARTFALYSRATVSGRRTWDVSADEGSQMYLGRSGETDKAIQAVEATRGVVLTADMGSRGWKIFPAYYSSTCGGKTQAGVFLAANLDPRIAPLKGGVRCSGCVISPRYQWPDVVVSDRELTEAINKSPLVSRRFQKVVAVNVVARTHNRIAKIEVVDVTGQRLVFSGTQFRLLVGARRLPSTWCSVRAENGRFVFHDGHGFGHGVGLCQYGMEGMARQGYTGYEILLHYYPGAKLIRAY